MKILRGHALTTNVLFKHPSSVSTLCGYSFSVQLLQRIASSAKTPPNSSSSVKFLLTSAPTEFYNEKIWDEKEKPSEARFLCSRCRKIDLKSVYDRTIFLDQKVLSEWQQSDHLIRSAAITDHITSFHRECSLCALILSLDPPEHRRPGRDKFSDVGCHLRVFSHGDIRKLRAMNGNGRKTPSDIEGDNNVDDFIIAAFAGDPAAFHLTKIQEPALRTGVIIPSSSSLVDMVNFKSSPQKFDFLSRQIDQRQANFPLVRSFLDECSQSENESHRSCSVETKSPGLPKRVIDCRARRIVPFSSDKNYLALSYCWGSQSGKNPPLDTKTFNATERLRAHLNMSDELPVPAPATIEDAIVATLELGHQFLWVDCCCVKDDEDKQDEINNMDSIYEQAFATLIAVSATSVNSGLPGVSIPRTRQQPSVTIDGKTYVSTLRHLSLHITNSTWATRGWTYQELFLSRRCVFFTSDQVFFACRSSIQVESVLQSTYMPPLLTLDIFVQDLIRTSTDFVCTDDLVSHVFNYTQRFLTYDTDGLNAFKGILKKSAYHTYWGIPFSGPKFKSLTTEQAFCLGLLWETFGPKPSTKKITRRRGLPSWSWASVDGVIDFRPVLEPEDDYADTPDTNITPRLAVEDLDKKVLSVDDLRGLGEVGGRLVGERSRYLHVEGHVARVQLRRKGGANARTYVVAARREPVVVYSPQDTSADVVQLDCDLAEEMRVRLLQEEWDMLVLSVRQKKSRNLVCENSGLEDERGHVWHYDGLLLKREGGEARRIGLVRLVVQCKEDMPLLRVQKIKLG